MYIKKCTRWWFVYVWAEQTSVMSVVKMLINLLKSNDNPPWQTYILTYYLSHKPVVFRQIVYSSNVRSTRSFPGNKISSCMKTVHTCVCLRLSALYNIHFRWSGISCTIWPRAYVLCQKEKSDSKYRTDRCGTRHLSGHWTKPEQLLWSYVSHPVPPKQMDIHVLIMCLFHIGENPSHR